MSLSATSQLEVPYFTNISQPFLHAVYHNSHTLNCQRLLFLVCQQLGQVSADAASVATANSVLIVRFILKDLIEQLNAAQLLAFVEVPPEVLSGELGVEIQAEFAGLLGGSLVDKLAQAALASLAELPPKST